MGLFIQTCLFGRKHAWSLFRPSLVFFYKTAPLPPLKNDGNQKQFAAKSTLNMDDFDKEDKEKDGINLAGFLFGNIDERGELEDSDILDDGTYDPRFRSHSESRVSITVNYCKLL